MIRRLTITLVVSCVTACAHVQPRPIAGLPITEDVHRPVAPAITAARVAFLLDEVGEFALSKAGQYNDVPSVCVPAWVVAVALENAGERIDATAANLDGMHRVPALSVPAPPCDNYTPGDMVPGLTTSVASVIGELLDGARFSLAVATMFVDGETCARLQHAKAEISRARLGFSGILNFLRGQATSVYVPGVEVDLGICGGVGGA